MIAALRARVAELEAALRCVLREWDASPCDPEADCGCTDCAAIVDARTALEVMP